TRRTTSATWSSARPANETAMATSPIPARGSERSPIDSDERLTTDWRLVRTRADLYIRPKQETIEGRIGTRASVPAHWFQECGDETQIPRSRRPRLRGRPRVRPGVACLRAHGERRRVARRRRRTEQGGQRVEVVRRERSQQLSRRQFPIFV